MKQSASLIYILAFLILVNPSCIKTEEVDTIVHNAVIFSLNQENMIFESMAINDGKIIEIGKENQILNKYKSKIKIDLKKQFIYPGFIDAHCHFLQYGIQKQKINLENTNSFDEVITLLLKAKSSDSTTWIQGYGWDQNRWENKNWPTNEKLNSIFPNQPIIVSRIDGHAIMVNHKAIEIANIPLDTVIEGGYIENIQGEYTGLFIDNAMDLIYSKIPDPTDDEKKMALLKAQQDCIAVGLTTVDIAGIDYQEIKLIKNLHKSGELKIRIYAMISDKKENFSYFLDTIGEPIILPKLSVRSFKFFADGSLGSRGACLIKPYSDLKKKHYGQLLTKIEEYHSKLELLHEYGFQACTHAIGDSANREILNQYSNILKGGNDLRWRIEHAQCVNYDDLHYFRDNNIIPSVQPTHATSDFIWALTRIGKQRLLNCYQYSTLFKENQLIALGTDFPVEGINPLHTFYAAVYRKNKANKPIGGFQIDEALRPIDALKGITFWAALANFEEKTKGSLEKGKYADFVVLNNEITTCNEDEILKTKVLRTFINGEEVYKN
ncbi:MAG: amidohydrolase [Flavobacteriales bacterium]|nr:amidohydrolase [Flavobacteriales bacterium]